MHTECSILHRLAHKDVTMIFLQQINTVNSKKNRTQIIDVHCILLSKLEMAEAPDICNEINIFYTPKIRL